MSKNEMNESSFEASQGSRGSWVSQNPMAAAVFAAAILVAGALVFLGVRMGNGGGSSDAGSFAEQLAAYEQQQQQAQMDAQAEQERMAAEQAKNVPEIGNQDHVLGKKNAKITIFEYSDFECPFCKSFAPTAKQVVDAFDGDVNLVYRHFPLDFHDPHATDAALASECAADLGGNDAFWKFHDVYFEKTNSNKGIEKSQVYAIAKDIGVNQSAFTECIDSEKFLDKVQSDMSGGAMSGVTGTPGNIIRNNDTGDVLLLPGAYPLESFQAAVNELLAK